MTPASWFTVARIYQDARASIRPNNHNHEDPVRNQGYLRRVSAEFHRRLKAAGIHVEGAQ
jgi:hypothetical protein